jgi:hypothetical protein
MNNSLTQLQCNHLLRPPLPLDSSFHHAERESAQSSTHQLAHGTQFGRGPPESPCAGEVHVADKPNCRAPSGLMGASSILTTHHSRTSAAIVGSSGLALPCPLHDCLHSTPPAPLPTAPGPVAFTSPLTAAKLRHPPCICTDLRRCHD